MDDRVEKNIVMDRVIKGEGMRIECEIGEIE